MGLSQTPQALVPAAFTSGGMTLISETVANASTGISFTSLGSYKQLLLIYGGIRHSTTGSAFSIRFNNDATTNIYLNAGAGMQGATLAFEVTPSTSIRMDGAGNTFMFGESTNYNGVAQDAQGYLLLDNYTSSTKQKQYVAQCYNYNNSPGSYRGFTITGTYTSTSAITTLDIVRLTGSATFSNSTNTTIRLYGIS